MDTPATTFDPQKRLVSLDALRGFDMFWIVGGDAFFRSLAKAGDWGFSPEVLRQLEHAEWEGFRFYDLIFPLFLFLVGCVIPFSLEKYRANPGAVYARIVRRTALLFMLGLIYAGILQFDWANQRYAGVLQRIAICYGLAAVVYLNFNWKARIGISAGILLAYWALVGLIQVDASLGVYSKEGNVVGYLDRNLLPGKIYPQYYGYGDNEGLLSTLPAVVTALLGIFTGEWLRSSSTGWQKVGGLVLAGCLMLALGVSWSSLFPIIKNLWTSSFVLVAAGWSLLLVAIFYTIIDVIGWQRWAFLWVVIGTNAITIYTVRRIIDFPKISDFFLGGVAGMTGNWAAVILAAGVLIAEWFFLWYLYRQKLFLRV